MRIFQREIFGPVLAATTFKDEKKHLKSQTTPFCALVQGYGQEMPMGR